ncbi:MAG: formylmethanofuran dehydrogenase [Methanosphaera sp.]|nr:formylmethanofuran dehydrogenase [Methanosphaera sp.]
MDELDVVINTGSSIIQAFYEKKGSTLKDEYRQSTAVAFMDSKDMKLLSLKPRDKIDVITKWGEVTLFADKSYDTPHRGMIFIPKGPWSNIIVSPETYCCNIPTYKGIKGKVRKSDKEVLLVADLMRKTYNKYPSKDDRSLGQLPIYIKRG